VIEYAARLAHDRAVSEFHDCAAGEELRQMGETEGASRRANPWFM
jgi:hypothetical protein